MRRLSTTELLDVWERGLVQSPLERALALLAAACPETDPDVLARLSIGQRDARLLSLREWTFGPQLTGLATCPACGGRLESTFNSSDVQADNGSEPAETLRIQTAGYELRFRLPDSLDMAALTENSDLAANRQLLLERCLLEASKHGVRISASDLPAEVTAAVAECMAQADPQGDVQLALSCPACGHEWQATFDIVSFFWSEIGGWAERILHEVHLLASAYGWSEAEILTLTAWRRQFYLEKVGRI